VENFLSATSCSKFTIESDLFTALSVVAEEEIEKVVVGHIWDLL
jgi:hypothetical protein